MIVFSSRMKILQSLYKSNRCILISIDFIIFDNLFCSVDMHMEKYRNKTPEIQRSLGFYYIFSSFCFLFCLCLCSNFRLMREISNKISTSAKSCINDKLKYLAPVTIKSVEIVPFTMKKIIIHNPPFFQFIFILPFPTFKFLNGTPY